MSADNAYAVWEQNGMWNVDHVFISPMDDDCQYLQNRDARASFKVKEEAIAYAHNCVEKEYIVEYGVIVEKILDKPCGECWVCTNERNL